MTPAVTILEAAIARLEESLMHDPKLLNARHGFDMLKCVVSIVRQIYPNLYGSITERTMADYMLIGGIPSTDVNLTLVDGADADVTAFLTASGAGGLHNGGAAVPYVRAYTLLNGGADFTDDALETAKGTPPAAGDIFVIGGSGATYIS